jgi:hypothetical protein
MSYYDRAYHRVFDLHLTSGLTLPSILPDHVMLCMNSQAMKDEIVTIESKRFYYKMIDIDFSEAQNIFLGKDIIDSGYGFSYLEKDDGLSYQVSSQPYFLFDDISGQCRQAKNLMGKMLNKSIIENYTIEDHLSINRLGTFVPNHIFAEQYASFAENSKDNLSSYFSKNKTFASLQKQLHKSRPVTSGLTRQN